MSERTYPKRGLGLRVPQGNAEHSSKLFTDSLEKLLDGSGVTNEGRGHFESARRDVANSGLNVVRNPLDKVGGVLVLDV